MFRAFWRWHFYASVVVIPVLLVLAITGLFYLFRFEIEPVLHGDLMRVEASAGQTVLPYEVQRFNAATAHPDDTIVSMTEPGAPDQSTRFTLTTPSEETRDVFVNPYTAEVLGDLNPDTTLSGRAIRLHADLMSGRVGDLVMELGRAGRSSWRSPATTSSSRGGGRENASGTGVFAQRCCVPHMPASGRSWASASCSSSSPACRGPGCGVPRCRSS